MSAPLYVSTRGGADPVPFREALLDGLAPDGGLYVPTHVPALPAGWQSATALADLGGRVLAEWLPEVDRLDALVMDALSFPIPLVPLRGGGWDGVHVLELFHGPTLSFKDVGARTMARLMGAALGGEPVTILAATSGDTGSAVASGFEGVEGVRVVLLYPMGQVSAVQERQLIVERDNVQALAVEGTFDDCQRLVKQAFSEARPAKGRLSSANSINIGRLLPQTLYYLWAGRELAVAGAEGPPAFVVPSGNLGNLTAGTLAMRGGLDVAGFLAAHNANDGFPRFLDGGDPPAGDSVRTLSNAMDVGVPSNLERLRSLFSDDQLRSLVRGEAVTDEETTASMRRVHDETGYLADPHTAVGLEAARRARGRGEAGPMIVLSTAHPAKFPEAVEAAAGVAPEAPERLASLWDAPVSVETIPSTLDALRAHL
ncbi:threonine synthase [Rubrivirga marina]|uniref:Threonine synthase n=1 Tax=Rubrivirga marina TaxID=1196024 RepID=A0A271IVD3_9BACT|nr:threonine synthase [Rubrivirga marina]PAP75183.1 threonine synthase [Rubrivirga marina]